MSEAEKALKILRDRRAQGEDTSKLGENLNRQQQESRKS